MNEERNEAEQGRQEGQALLSFSSDDVGVARTGSAEEEHTMGRAHELAMFPSNPTAPNHMNASRTDKSLSHPTLDSALYA